MANDAPERPRDPDDPAGAIAACETVKPGPSPLRRLTRFEYNNTIRDLLGDDSRPADAFPPEEKGNGFGNDADVVSVSRLLADQHLEAAAAIAKRAGADQARWARLLGCDPSTMGESQCAAHFIATFGPRALRGPLDEQERQRFLDLYDAERARFDFKRAIESTLQALLLSPRFLYRVEVSDTPAVGGVVRVDPYQMASRLSYLLWASMPDDELLAAAAAGALVTREQIRVHAERLLADPRARSVEQHFHGILFGIAGIDGLQKNRAEFPTFDPALAGLLKQEMVRFFDHVLWEGEGDLGTLLSARYSFRNRALANHYGEPGPSGDAFERVELAPQRRAGFLTQAGLLASTTPGTHTNPVIRGVYIRNRLLCEPPPDPPPTLMVKEPDPDPTLTTRERFAAHNTEPSCQGCHRLMDPLGFGLEHFDGIGRWRDEDNGKPVDVSGHIAGTDVEGDFHGAVELADRLAGSAQVKSCMVANWFTFAYGRRETEEDECSRATLEAAFSESGGNIPGLLLALTQTDAFLYRSTEVQP